jgi:hypothetical protein
MAIVTGGTGNNTYSWTSNPVGFTSTIYNPLAYPVVSTTYIAAVNDGFGYATDSVSVTVLPLPGIPETPAGPDTVDLSITTSSDYITTGASSASSYSWEIQPQNSGTISGTGTTGTVAWNTNFLGTALIGVKGLNSCGESILSNEKQTIVVNSTTGIVQNPSRFSVLIYPNPASDFLNIEFPGYSAKLPAILEIYEIRGSMIIRVSIAEMKTRLDISAFPAAVYMLKLTVGNESRMIKFVKCEM